jgi:hypothetical protein
MTFWEFWHEHYILAFFAVWLTAWAIAVIAKCLVALVHGWPD